MVVKRELITDHLLICESCKRARKSCNDKIEKHLEKNKNFEICSCCGELKHVIHCKKCRSEKLTLHYFILIHLWTINFKNKIKNVFK